MAKQRTIERKGWQWAAVPSEVITSKQLDHGAVRVYACLLWRAGQSDRAWPSIPSLAADCHMSAREVMRALKSLIDENWIYRRRRMSGSTVTYVFERREDGKTFAASYATGGLTEYDSGGMTVKPPAAEQLSHPRHEEPEPINQKVNHKKLIDSSAAAVKRNEPKPAAAAAVVWGYGSFEMSRKSRLILEERGAEPQALIGHYFQALCNPRIKSPMGAALRAATDEPDGPAREPWSLLGTYDPIQMAEALVDLQTGGYVAGALHHVAQALNGRHAAAAVQAMQDLGLVDLAGRIRAQRQAAQLEAEQAAALAAPAPQELDAWQLILAEAQDDPVTNYLIKPHLFIGARLVSVEAGVLTVAVNADTAKYMTPARTRNMFGDNRKIKFVEG